MGLPTSRFEDGLEGLIKEGTARGHAGRKIRFKPGVARPPGWLSKAQRVWNTFCCIARGTMSAASFSARTSPSLHKGEAQVQCELRLTEVRVA